ncbi:MAG: 6,7-dimethyl-8-ribityllumazine synthase [Bacteriovoracaceae bacterium]|nr:6,7-dimethyl-8-ribityllumazine synthase [Bacteriovoracaceae bacterium]
MTTNSNLTTSTSSPSSPRIWEGRFSIPNHQKVAIVVSKFNEMITDPLLQGSIERFYQYGVSPNQIEIVKVPGAYEIPVTIQKLISMNKFQGFLALGAVIKGETAHFDYVCSHVNNGIGQLMLDAGIPIAMGVLTTNSFQQAMDRIGGVAGHKGAEAATALVEMMNLWGQFKEKI